ncbi:MAG: EscU/YscU/HrcU family type III secretion system export apparatus switch protein [Enterovibrio sp.]
MADSSSEDKTEDPTDKKLRDSAEEGQTYKFKELVYFFNVVLVIFSLYATNLSAVVEVALDSLSDINVLRRYIETAKNEIVLLFIIPVVVSIFSVSLPSLIQTKFVLATKAIKIDFAKLNPVTGFQNLFSMKTVIDACKSVFVHIFGFVFIIVWFYTLGSVLFEFMHVLKEHLGEALFDFTVIFIIIAMLIIFLSTTPFIFFEIRQHINDLKMTKQDVKRENKDQNGNPEIKSKRQEFHRSLLSDKDESDVKRSAVILANPTHLAIGIYFNINTAPIPMVSIKHEDYKALEVLRIAQENKIPIIRNVRLTRSIYKSNDRYTLILNDNLMKVLYLLHWLENIHYSLPVYNEQDVDVW